MSDESPIVDEAAFVAELVRPGRRPNGAPILPQTKAEWLRWFKRAMSATPAPSKTDVYERIGKAYDRSPDVVRQVLIRLQPTVDLATAHVQARAFDLTQKVLKNADTSELIDVLSRPNIGVLEPIRKGPEGGVGIVIGVSAESCGAVRVGVSYGVPEGIQQGLQQTAGADDQSGGPGSVGAIAHQESEAAPGPERPDVVAGAEAGGVSGADGGAEAERPARAGRLIGTSKTYQAALAALEKRKVKALKTRAVHEARTRYKNAVARGTARSKRRLLKDPPPEEF